MDATLRQMAAQWYGYGRWSAPYWFIGPEPGMASHEGDNSLERCRAWARLGSPELLDCIEHHREFGLNKWHGSTPPTQSTWRQLIRLLLAYKGLSTDNDTIRRYQGAKWGTAGGESAVLELSSLAARNLGTPRDRHAFQRQRIETLRFKILEYKPAFVVMYGYSNRADWCELVQTDLVPDKIVMLGPTACVLLRHPVGGKPAEPASYWIRAGERLREVMGGGSLF